MIKIVPLFTLILFSNSAFSEKEKVVQACFSEWGGFTYEENGKAKGISIKIAEKAFEGTGFKLESFKLPWKRCFAYAQAGKVKAIYSMYAYNPKSPLLMGPEGPTLWIQVLWVRENGPYKEMKYTGPEKWQGKVIGNGRGYAIPSFFKNSKIIIDESPNDLSVLKMVASGRVDAGIAEYIVSNKLIKNKKVSNVRPLLPAFLVGKLCLGFNKKYAHIQKIYNSRVKTLFKDGTINKIYKRYTGNTYDELLDKFVSQKIKENPTPQSFSVH